MDCVGVVDIEELGDIGVLGGVFVVQVVERMELVVGCVVRLVL